MIKKNTLFLAIVCAAFCLRGPLTGIGSILPFIRDDFLLDASSAGMITTLPLIAFAAVSPLVNGISKKYGAGKSTLAGLLISVLGVIIRSYCGVYGLYAGTLILGSGISFINVLLPSIIKEQYSDKVGIMTSMYSTAMVIFAGVSPGISVPLSHTSGFGWQNALALWAIPLTVAFILWIPQASLQLSKSTAGRKSSIMRSPITWSVAAFMGIQSFLFYSFVSWLPSILLSKGVTTEMAGTYAAIYQFIGIPGSILAPLIAGRMKDQRVLMVILTVLYAYPSRWAMLLELPAHSFLAISTILLRVGHSL